MAIRRRGQYHTRAARLLLLSAATVSLEHFRLAVLAKSACAARSSSILRHATHLVCRDHVVLITFSIVTIRWRPRGIVAVLTAGILSKCVVLLQAGVMHLI